MSAMSTKRRQKTKGGTNLNANEVIRQNIASRGIKQNYVAEKAGIAPELFRRSLAGERKIPADEFVAICNVLALDIKDFRPQNAPAI